MTAPDGTPAVIAEAAPTALLSAAGLIKSFGLTPALHGADLVIRAGEIVAVMGPSGSGKSTLLHCAAGILPPDAGSVMFEGEELTCMSDRDRSELRRMEFGFIFQFGQLIPELTCRQNVAMPLRLDGMRRKPAEAAATSWLARLDVGPVGSSQPGRISGGQAQRVAVARGSDRRPVGDLRRRTDRSSGLAAGGEGDGFVDSRRPGDRRSSGVGDPRTTGGGLFGPGRRGPGWPHQ